MGSNPALPTMDNLQKLLIDKCLISRTGVDVEEIIEKFIRKKIKIIYGETYDEYGMTIDSLKYYLFFQDYTKYLRNWE